jgi:hypothetical protein
MGGVTCRREVGLPVITLPSETWRSVIAVLRASGIVYMAEHADRLEREIDQHPPHATSVSLSLAGDIYLRSSNWARLQLDILLPPDDL